MSPAAHFDTPFYPVLKWLIIAVMITTADMAATTPAPSTGGGAAVVPGTAVPGTGVSGSSRARCAAGWCLVEARPSVLAVSLLRYLTGGVLAASEFAHGHPLRTLAGAPIWELAVFAVYLFNGVMDTHEDRVNGSGRPIARGVLSPRLARRVAAGAAAAALMGSIALGIPSMAAIAAYLIVGYLYSGPPCYLKRQPIGSAVAAASLGPLMCYGGLTAYAGDSWTLPGAGWLAVAAWTWLWMGLVGAPAKDLGDVIGDAAARRRTLPVMYGQSRVRLVVSISAVSLAIAFVVVSSRLSWWLAVPGAVMLAGAGAVALLSMKQPLRSDRSHLRRPYRAFMVTQFAVYLAVIASTGAIALLPGKLR